MKAKTVHESLGKYLTPKSDEEIKKASVQFMKNVKKNQLPHLNQIKEQFDELPYFDDFMKTFKFKKEMWVDDPAWSHLKTGDREYEMVDVTDKAKKIIYDSIENIESDKPLKVFTVSFLTSNRLLRLISMLYAVRDKDPNRSIDIRENPIYTWVYKGSNYVQLGNPDGKMIYILPEDFLENIFNK